MKNVIIATDFSSHSKNTFQHVLKMLQDTKIPCQIILLNTYMVNEKDPGQVISANDRLKNESRERLEIERQEILKLISNPNITVTTASHIGSLNNVLHQLMQKDQVDLVVMGKGDQEIVAAVSKVLKNKNCRLFVSTAIAET